MTTVTYLVAADGDDWHATIDGSTVNASSEGAGAGRFVSARSNSNANTRRNAGWRLTASGGAPAGLKGATINSAIPKLIVENTTRDDANLDFFGVAEDDPSGWSTSRRPLTGDVAFTSASVSWVEASLGTGEALGPDIKTIIQEIVNRAGFTDASHIAIIAAGKDIATDHDVSCLAHESATGTYLELAIDYTEAAAESTAIPALLPMMSPKGW